MPFDKKEYMKEYDKQYREKNREKIAKKKKQYYQKNKDILQEKNKEYREKNKEKKKEYMKKYCQTEKGKKSYRITQWKSRGIVHHNFDELYEKFINTEYCELCNVKLTEDKRTTPTTRVLDHCHETGEFRNVLCNSCNVKRK